MIFDVYGMRILFLIFLILYLLCVFKIVFLFFFFFFFKQKTAYEMRISDWSSDVCSSDLYVHKLKTGQGQVVDTSLMEAAIQQTYWHAASYFATGESAGPTGSAHLLAAPYQAFRTRDGWINIGGANQANWERIAQVMGHPQWRDDARFATNSDRMANLDALVALMDAVLQEHDTAHWIEAFDAAGVPAGPVHTIGQALSHPQTLARNMVIDLAHSQAGPTKALGCAIQSSHTPNHVRPPAPTLGEPQRGLLRANDSRDSRMQ